jgi:fido (protein-threonine AMPylation protein)
MTVAPPAAAVRRVHPVVPPLDAEAVPVIARHVALDTLAELRRAAAFFDNPDLFHRPRFRTKMWLKHVGAMDPEHLTERIAAAAENRAAAGLLAVHSVREELREHPGERPCFTPDSLAELHRLLIADDPNIVAPGGFRRTRSEVRWADGQIHTVPVAPGAELRDHMERWYQWGTRTASPPLDAAAFVMVRLLTIHPFADANGRMGRLIGQCDLVAAGLMPGLLLDLDSWVHAHRDLHDTALVAASDGDWNRWGEVFAQAVTETARHRIASIATYRGLLHEAIGQVEDDPAAAAVLDRLRATPAVSADWLRGRIPHDPEPALDRLRSRGVLTPHPRLPGALIHPELIAVLDAPCCPSKERQPVGGHA